MQVAALKNNLNQFFSSLNWLAGIFLISGVSALIYQIVWQRALFTIFGVDIESVTVVVSIFMFGLGIGALIGGYIQRKFPNSLLKIFFIFEVLIGLYGIISIYLISIAGNFTASNSILSLGINVFAALAIPTLLMGATLPILVSYLNKFYQNIGKSLALLYAFNTLGAGISAFLTVEILFVFLGQKGTLLFAIGCNFLTAYLVYCFSKKAHTQPISEVKQYTQKNTHSGFSYLFVLIAAGAIGYISLSQEILWYRTLGFIGAGKPHIFAYVLAAFLIGIASGAYRAEKICESGNVYPYLIKILVISCIAYYASFAIISHGSGIFGKIFSLISFLAVEYVAYLTGGVFPILAYIGVNNSKNESGVSLVYFCNITGSILGPLVTGFVLLEYFSLTENIVIITILSIALTLIIIFASPCNKSYKIRSCSAIAALTIAILLFHNLSYANFLENLQYGNSNGNKPFKTIIENRSGIITVQEDPSGDIIYGGGIYDGRMNIDPVINSNGITRAYMIAAMHPNPKRVLEIGLSSGSWAKVLTSYKPITELISIEINKGYIEIINNDPVNKSILTDKKAKLYFDDGRRWLKNNPNEKFDIIVMNTTYHWRNNITNLVSKEFLELAKTHLNKGGIIYYNTTGSKDVIYTAANVFSYVTIFDNFVAASDSPFVLNDVQKKENFLKFIDDSNRPIFKIDNKKYQNKLSELINYNFPDTASEILNKRDLWLITDDNMATEYKLRN